MPFIYWFRDDPNRPLGTDIQWAAAKFQLEFGHPASKLLVNQNEESLFKDFGLEVEINKGIAEGYFGIQ